MFDVNAILQKTDLIELVEKAGGQLDNHRRCACPIHGGHDASGFSVYTKDGETLWKCFTGDCGGGDAIAFVMAWRGYDFKRACAFLGGEVQGDPVEMKRLADERMERARKEYEEKQQRLEAARRELQVAEMHLHYHNTMGAWAKMKWQERGLDEGMQSFWTLGACNDFVVGDNHHTPTLTIPILSEERNLLNIKHRLLMPPKPNDKYRPERHGLGAFPPFLAIPEMGYDGGLVVVVEGEIKAMVTWTRISDGDVQIIGVPGKSQFKSMGEKLQGKNVLIVPDPGGEREAWELARSLKARYLPMAHKIDDYILETGIASNDLYALFKQARQA